MKYFHIVIALFLITFASSHCFAANSKREGHKRHQQEMTKDSNLKLSGKVENGIRIIEVKASRYKFEPDPIVVNLGEKVRLVVTSADVTHGIAISEFNAKLSVAAGKTETIEFIADKKGTFHAYCSVYCGPGHGHMHAKFAVK